MEIKDVINNLKRSTNIEIIAKDLIKTEVLIVFKGTVYNYKRDLSKSIINIMSVYNAQFVNKNKVEIIFYINHSVLKDRLESEGIKYVSKSRH